MKLNITFRRFWVAVWTGFIGGNIASFVKWGTENPLPPRVSGRAIPPYEMLQDLGLNADALVYQYSGHLVNWGVAGIHHLFSLVFGIFYCVLAEVYPKITLWQGLAFSFILTIGFHGVVLPVFGWAPPVWALPNQEMISEIIGHGLFMWTIEIFRRYYKNSFS